MGIVLSKPPHPKKAMELARFLMPVDRSQLEISDGKIPITPNLRFIDEHVGKTIHRFNSILHVLHFREIHLIPIVFEMARLLPELQPEEMGTDDDLISPLQMFLLLKIFEDRPEDGTFGMVNHQTRARLFAQAKEIQFPSQLSVVSFTGLLKHVEKFFQRLFGW